MTLLVPIDAIRLMRVYDVVLWMARRARPLENVPEGPPRMTTQHTNVRKWVWGSALKMNCSMAFVVEKEVDVTTIQFGLQLWSQVINCKTCLVRRATVSNLIDCILFHIEIYLWYFCENLGICASISLKPYNLNILHTNLVF